MKKLMLVFTIALGALGVSAADLYIERDQKYVVDSSAADYQERLAEIGSYETIFLDYGAVIEFNLTAPVDLTLHTRISSCYGGQIRTGKLIKKGAGILRFETMRLGSNDYNVALDVQSGALYLPQTNKIGLQYGTTVNVAAGAVLWTQAGETDAANKAATFSIDELTGAGDVYGWSTLKISNDCTFSGALHITGTVMALGHLTLTGTGSEFTNVIQVDNTVANGTVTKRGILELGSPTSYDTTLDFHTLNNGGEVRLNGNAETKWTYVNRVDVRANGAPARNDTVLNAGPVVSAGSVGNFDWTGGWRFSYAGYDYPTGIPGVWYFTLDGDNVEYPAICSGKILDTLNKGDALRYVWAIRKRGTGIWRIKANSGSNWSGPLFVENGVLQYDTIADAGANCALGTAANLYKPTWTNIYESLGYAIGVGSADEPSWKGLLECTAATAVSMKTRPVRVLGTGGFKAEAGTVDWSDISADNANATLVLSGSNGGDNIVRNLDDGDGKLSVLKEGTGTWRIADRATITGDIVVNGGKLALNNGKGIKYSYFRWLIKENAIVCSRYSEYFKENGGAWPTDKAAELPITTYKGFNLYDADGNCLMTPDNMTVVTPAEAEAGLSHGQLSFDPEHKPSNWNSTGILNNLTHCFTDLATEEFGINSAAAKYDPNDEATWAGMCGVFRKVLPIPCISTTMRRRG